MSYGKTKEEGLDMHKLLKRQEDLDSLFCSNHFLLLITCRTKSGEETYATEKLPLLFTKNLAAVAIKP